MLVIDVMCKPVLKEAYEYLAAYLVGGPLVLPGTKRNMMEKLVINNVLFFSSENLKFAWGKTKRN